MNVTRPARSCRRRRTTQRQGRSLDATLALGSRPAPNVIQPARPHQAASSRATLAGGAARAAKLGIFTVAPPAQPHGHLRPGTRGRPSLRRNSRPSRGSAALAFPTSGVSTERVRGQHAWSQMHGRLRRRCGAEEDRCPVFASRAASADRYDSTCYRVTRCETGHSCCRAAHWRTACMSCGATAHCRQSDREREGEPSFEGQARHRLPRS